MNSIRTICFCFVLVFVIFALSVFRVISSFHFQRLTDDVKRICSNRHFFPMGHPFEQSHVLFPSIFSSAHKSNDSGSQQNEKKENDMENDKEIPTMRKENNKSLTVPDRVNSRKSREQFESRGEKETRKTVEFLFGVPFPKTRPTFLNNIVLNNKRNLEIDCFNSALKLGFEYQGKQHYSFYPYFHSNKEAFQNQLYRDHLKKMLCLQQNVKLFEVPFIQNNSIFTFVVDQLTTDSRNCFIKHVTAGNRTKR